MKKISAYLTRLRTERGWTQREVSDRTGIGINTVSSHENGHTTPSSGLRKMYAQAYGFATLVDFDEGWRQTAGVNAARSGKEWIAVINKAPAGKPANYEECYPDSSAGMEYIARSPDMEPGGDLFAFVVVGDSMASQYVEGDYCVCEWIDPIAIEDGEPVFVRLGSAHEHKCTFKRAYRLDNDRVELRPDNNRYPVMIVRKKDIDRMAPVIEHRRRTTRFRKARQVVHHHDNEG